MNTFMVTTAPASAPAIRRGGPGHRRTHRNFRQSRCGRNSARRKGSGGWPRTGAGLGRETIPRYPRCFRLTLGNTSCLDPLRVRLTATLLNDFWPVPAPVVPDIADPVVSRRDRIEYANFR